MKNQRPYAELGKRISVALQSLKKTQSWVRNEMGVSQGAISQWIGGYQKPKELYKLSKILNVDIKWLEGAQMDETKNKNSLQPRIAGVLPTPQWGPDLVPVLGNANGSSDAVVLNFDEPIGQIMRHPNQQGMKSAFALYTKGESMSPRYMPGDPVYAIANKPPARGQDCIVEMKNGESFVKHFVRQTDKEIVCRQFNPEKDWKRPIDEVRALHAVVGRG